MLHARDALRYYAPSPALARYVTVIFSWTGSDAAFAEWMPSIDAQIAIRLAGTGSFGFERGTRVVPAQAAVVGALSRTVELTTSAGFRSIGVGLSGAGWRALVGDAAERLIDRVTDLSELWGEQPVAAMLERLHAAPTAAQQVAALEAALLAQLARGRDDWRERAVDHWIARSDLSVDALKALLGVGARQAARLTLASHGFSPKLLAMKHRALRAATRLASEGMLDWSEHGYADQSHMIRDFHRFIGATPGRFVERELARHVFAAPEHAGAHLARIG